eukprot:scaffold194612_cov64-Attheya_sp.AAC.1
MNDKNLRKQAHQINTLHEGIVPSDFKKLTKLQGVGPQIANILLFEAFDINNGIAVDIHVERMTNLLSWAHSQNTDIVRQHNLNPGFHMHGGQM